METLVPTFAAVLVLTTLALHDDAVIRFHRVWKRMETRLRSVTGRRFTPSPRVVRQYGRPWCE